VGRLGDEAGAEDEVAEALAVVPLAGVLLDDRAECLRLITAARDLRAALVDEPAPDSSPQSGPLTSD